jgi:DNA-binding transcriptional ArsR family regulator
MGYPDQMPLTHPLPDPVVELIARRFQILGEPIRIRLLERLRDGEATVGELVEATGAGQQNVSKHLGVLLRGGVVTRRKQGTSVYYGIADDVVFRLCEEVCGSLEREVAALGDLLSASRR